ncbi:hypothetical protein F4859DRAFT_519006 [Xylaria cf. heliscus]|nr:hypothetical protein F4859DRAFT_519006 [Xylaria cf. heliscus]
MEAIAALGLASNIIQLINFSSKLITGAFEVYNSASGVVEEFENAQDQKLVSLMQGCEKLSHELQSLIQKTKAKRPKSKAESFRASWKALMSKGELKSIKARLNQYPSQTLTLLLVMIGDDMSTVHRSLELLIEKHDKNTLAARNELREATKTILDTIRSGTRTGQSHHGATKMATLETIQRNLLQISRHMKSVLAEDEVLGRLRFEYIGVRQRTVEDAHTNTYRWLLYDPNESSNNNNQNSPKNEDYINYIKLGDLDEGSTIVHGEEDEEIKRSNPRRDFINWLRNDHGTFYISGKAGSGKSTLMKFLANDKRTYQELKHWSVTDGKPLIFTQFFFWNSGVPLQRSVEGPYRSILWDVLRQCPDLVPDVFPNEAPNDMKNEDRTYLKTQEFPFELSELRAAADRLCKSQQRVKLCLFIDGLDEYEGNYWKLSKSIELHELTRNDMYRYVRNELYDDERYTSAKSVIDADLGHHGIDESKLVTSIVGRADGVFLWVKLATESLLKGIRNHFSIAQLYKKLDTVPKGLEGMF